MSPIMIPPSRKFERSDVALGAAAAVVLLISVSGVTGAFLMGALGAPAGIALFLSVLPRSAAPWSMRVVLEGRWKLWPLMLFAAWFTVDGSYSLYWHFRNPAALEMMREANFFASLALYGLCGVVWLYRGSLHDLMTEIRRHLRI